MFSTTLDFSFDDLSTVFSARYLPRCGLSSWKNNNRRNWKKQAFLFSPRARIASRRVPPFPSFFSSSLPLRSDGFRRSWKSSATSREISRMLKAPRIKVERVSTQCSRTMTMTNRRVGQVLPLLTIRTTIAACPIRA